MLLEPNANKTVDEFTLVDDGTFVIIEEGRYGLWEVTVEGGGDSDIYLIGEGDFPESIDENSTLVEINKVLADKGIVSINQKANIHYARDLNGKWMEIG